MSRWPVAGPQTGNVGRIVAVRLQVMQIPRQHFFPAQEARPAAVGPPSGPILPRTCRGRPSGGRVRRSVYGSSCHVSSHGSAGRQITGTETQGPLIPVSEVQSSFQFQIPHSACRPPGLRHTGSKLIYPHWQIYVRQPCYASQRCAVFAFSLLGVAAATNPGQAAVRDHTQLCLGRPLPRQLKPAQAQQCPPT